MVFRRLNFIITEVNKLINGKTDSSPEMALKLSKVFGKDPNAWFEIQSQHSLWQACK